MSSLFCCIANRNNEIEDETIPTWMNFLKTTGHNLWSLRHEFHSIQDENGITLPLNNAPQSKSKYVKVLWQPSAFQHFEDNHGMDKFKSVSDSYIKNRHRLPLTQCTGETWERNRPIVCTALANVPKLSLEAAQQVDWRYFLESTASQNVDLRQVVLEAAELWNRWLFVGTNDITDSAEYQSLLKQATLEYWKEIRAKNKNQASMKKTLDRLESVLPWNHFAKGDHPWQYPPSSSEEAKQQKGVFQSLYESEIQQSATDNAVNALIASLDAVQALVFWTLWNLSRQTGAWELCENIPDDQAKRDLLQLSIFKKQATQGKTIQVKNISFLAAALLETVRVYPPVWTLPRTWHNADEAISCKLDVVLCNQATAREWNPSHWLDDSTSDFKIGSFGLGKRYCPAGTGGLYAAYELLRSFISISSKVEECQPDQVLNDSYLGPTLCIDGHQLFRVTMRS